MVEPTPVQVQAQHWFLLKYVFMYILILADLYLNTSVEYDRPSGDIGATNITILMLMYVVFSYIDLCLFNCALFCSLQVVIQILATLDLFVLLGGTFLFRSGLLGILGSQFQRILLLHPVYICCTIALGASRAVR